MNEDPCLFNYMVLPSKNARSQTPEHQENDKDFLDSVFINFTVLLMTIYDKTEKNKQMSYNSTWLWVFISSQP